MSEKNVSQQYTTGWIMLLALFTSLGPLSIDMYLPALPQMATEFNVSTQQISNTLPAYFFGLALGQLIYGPISDRIGRKKPLYFGMVLYTVASLLCVIAPDHWSLIAARILQALGGCVGVVIARAAIRDRLDMQSSAQAFASMMIVMGIAPVIAPVIGAAILHFFSWHAVFIALSLVGVLCLICVHFKFQETLETDKRLSLSFSQVFILYASIFKDKSFRLPMMAGCFTGAALFCYISAAPAVLMDGYQLSQQQFAIAFGFNAFGIVVIANLNQFLAKKLSIIQRLTLGGIIQVSGPAIIMIAGLLSQASLFMVMLGLFLTVSGIGFTGPNSMAFAMSEQGSRAGTASAIMGSMQFACGLMGGVILNFLSWSPVLNMSVLMLCFTVAGFMAILVLRREVLTKTI